MALRRLILSNGQRLNSFIFTLNLCSSIYFQVESALSPFNSTQNTVSKHLWTHLCCSVKSSHLEKMPLTFWPIVYLCSCIQQSMSVICYPAIFSPVNVTLPALIGDLQMIHSKIFKLGKLNGFFT